MLDTFARIDLTEPDDGSLINIVTHAARRLAADYDVEIPDSVVERTVSLTSSFLLSDFQPGKSVNVLQRV